MQPSFDDILVELPQNARRSENGGAFYMNRLTADSIGWKAFIQQLWKLQWTNVDTPLTESLEQTMYELCIGNVDFACRTFAKAQSLVIGTEDESICEVVLQDAYERECVSSKTSAVLMAKEALNSKRSSNNQSVTQVKPKTEVKTKSIPNVDRIQHPEFYDELRRVISTDNILELIPNPDLIRSASGAECPLTYFKESKHLCEDPFEEVFVS